MGRAKDGGKGNRDGERAENQKKKEEWTLRNEKGAHTRGCSRKEPGLAGELDSKQECSGERRNVEIC